MITASSTGHTRVLLRSLWATVNLGDVAHAPGAVRALQDAGLQVTLWPSVMGQREREMLAALRPDVTVVEGDIDDRGVPTTESLAEAWETCSLLVHGPAAGPAAAGHVRAWRDTGRPYAYLGVTVDPFGQETPSTLAQAADQIAALPPTYLPDDSRELLEGAAAVWCRDSWSLTYLRNQRLTGPVLGLAADATFVCDLRDDDSAELLLQRHGLVDQDFLVVVPRQRFSPYDRMRGTVTARGHYREAINAAHTATDMALVGAGITHWIRRTGQPVLIGPEMSYEVELARSVFPHTLPADVRSKVCLVDHYWSMPTLTSVLARAAGVLSMECHSPILASVVGTPALYLRLPTETVKGRMYADFDAGDMVVEAAASDAPTRLTEALDQLIDDPATAAARARTLQANAAASIRAAASAVTAVRHPQPV